MEASKMSNRRMLTRLWNNMLLLKIKRLLTIKSYKKCSHVKQKSMSEICAHIIILKQNMSICISGLEGNRICYVSQLPLKILFTSLYTNVFH